jgi:hypothetical protein
LLFEVFSPLERINKVAKTFRSFDKGGYVDRDTFGLLHKGEVVVPKSSPRVINLNVNNSISNRADANMMADIIVRRLESATRL